MMNRVLSLSLSLSHIYIYTTFLSFFVANTYIRNLSRGQLLVGAHGSVLRLFDLSTYKPIHDGFSGCSTGTSMIGACCSPDGQVIASGAQVK